MRRVAELEEQLAQRGDWEAERAKYRLEEYPTGVQIYVEKDLADNQPRVRLCPNCFHDGRKSILQTTSKIRNGEVVDCPRCTTQFELKMSEPRGPIRTSGYY
jgi:superfamily II helicase